MGNSQANSIHYERSNLPRVAAHGMCPLAAGAAQDPSLPSDVLVLTLALPPALSGPQVPVSGATSLVHPVEESSAMKPSFVLLVEAVVVIPLVVVVVDVVCGRHVVVVTIVVIYVKVVVFVQFSEEEVVGVGGMAVAPGEVRWILLGGNGEGEGCVVPVGSSLPQPGPQPGLVLPQHYGQQHSQQQPHDLKHHIKCEALFNNQSGECSKLTVQTHHIHSHTLLFSRRSVVETRVNVLSHGTAAPAGFHLRYTEHVKDWISTSDRILSFLLN